MKRCWEPNCYKPVKVTFERVSVRGNDIVHTCLEHARSSPWNLRRPLQPELPELPSSIEDAPAGLTLENFQDKMNMRFRMTKGQKQRGLTRQEAFEERYGHA